LIAHKSSRVDLTLHANASTRSTPSFWLASRIDQPLRPALDRQELRDGLAHRRGVIAQEPEDSGRSLTGGLEWLLIRVQDCEGVHVEGSWEFTLPRVALKTAVPNVLARACDSISVFLFQPLKC
jgi:hypothetical protein